MNRKFSDLHLRANPNDAQNRFKKAVSLGYNQLSIPLSESCSYSQLLSLRDKAQTFGLDFVLRADYKPRSQEDLTRFLRKNRRQFEVICILCENKEVARQAAKDHRVDLLNFPNIDYRKRYFDSAEAELACSSAVALEIDLKPLLVIGGPTRARLLTTLRREVDIAREFRIPVLLSSGVNEQALMRKPRDLASLGYLFGMKEEQSLDSVSVNPSNIVTRNRQKLTDKYVAPGITIVKEGNS